MATYRAVFHLNQDSDAQVAMVFNNIQNLLEDLGSDQVSVELVANGTGVNALLKANPVTSGRVTELSRQGVQFAACRNSLTGLKLTESAVNEGVTVVPSGVGELVRRQNEGWAYLKP